jgi:type I restriction enzyme S subunit
VKSNIQIAKQNRSKVLLGTFFVKSGGSVDPKKYQNEFFDLYSIPAYEKLEPEVVAGRKIGSSKKTVQPQDILLSRIVPHIRRAWVVDPSRGRRQIASSEWIVFRSKKLDPRYLCHYLISDVFHQQFMRTVSGVGGSLLRARPAEVAKIGIPLPPLEEQRRIAAILDKADAIRRKRRQAIQLAGEFLRSVFLDMFGDPVLNHRGWNEARLDQISEIVSGVTKGRKLINKATVLVPYMRVANVQDGRILIDDVQEIEALESEIEKFRLERGDILLTEGGDPDKLGRGAVWKGEIDPCIHQNHIFRVRTNNKIILPEYLSALIGSQRGKRYFFKAAKQTTGVASINKTQLSGFPALVPPIDIQDEYLNRLEKFDHMADIQMNKYKESGNLFNSLVQRAFRGEL